jgi:uncharacterized membrane protein
MLLVAARTAALVPAVMVAKVVKVAKVAAVAVAVAVVAAPIVVVVLAVIGGFRSGCGLILVSTHCCSLLLGELTSSCDYAYRYYSNECIICNCCSY